MMVRPQPRQTSSNKVEQTATQGESAAPGWPTSGAVSGLGPALVGLGFCVGEVIGTA